MVGWGVPWTGGNAEIGDGVLYPLPPLTLSAGDAGTMLGRCACGLDAVCERETKRERERERVRERC